MDRVTRRSFLRLGATSLSIPTVGCQFQKDARQRRPATAITRYKYDSGRTGGQETDPPPRSATVDWSLRPDIQNGLWTPWPLRVEDTLYVGFVTFGHFPGAVLAIDARTGERKWQQEIAANATPLAVSDDLILAGVQSAESETPSELVAFDRVSGEPRWSNRLESRAVRVPVVVDGIGLTTIGGTITAFDPQDGTIEWTVEESAAYGSPLAVSDGTAFGVVNASDGSNHRAIAVDVDSGDQRWSVASSEVPNASAVADGVMYEAGRQNTIRARDTADGRELWQTSVGGQESDPPHLSLAHGRVYVNTANAGKNVIALDAETGAVAWSSSSIGAVSPLPALRRHVLVPRDGAVAVLAADGGTKAYEFSTDGRVVTCSAADGELFLSALTPGTAHIRCIRS